MKEQRGPLTIGWIPYLNLLPFRMEAERAFPADVVWKAAHPTDVNRLLAAGEVAMAPSSSVCLIKCPHNEMVAPVGVVSDAEVMSVYLGFDHSETVLLELIQQRLAVASEIIRYAIRSHPDQMRMAAQSAWKDLVDLAPIATVAPLLKISTASATSASLAKFIYRICFGENASFTRVVTAQESHHFENELPVISLLIGDEALEQRSKFASILDLGAVWKHLTGLPFVYAVWQTAHPQSVLRYEDTLTAIAERAQTRMRVEPGHYLQRVELHDAHHLRTTLPDYWAGLRYRLTPNDMNGLLLFLALVRPLLKIETSDEVSAKLLRWQQRAQQLQF